MSNRSLTACTEESFEALCGCHAAVRQTLHMEIKDQTRGSMADRLRQERVPVAPTSQALVLLVPTLATTAVESASQPIVPAPSLQSLSQQACEEVKRGASRRPAGSSCLDALLRSRFDHPTSLTLCQSLSFCDRHHLSKTNAICAEIFQMTQLSMPLQTRSRNTSKSRRRQRRRRRLGPYDYWLMLPSLI